MNKALLRREQFPVTRELVYLNHAAVGPLSERAYRAMEMHARQQCEFGALHWRDWLEEYVQFRAEAATLIGATPKEISILKNTTEGLSFVAEGFRWKSGENVVTTAMEFPSNFAPWKRLERRGVECRTIEPRDGAYSPEDVEKMIDDKTRIVALSSVSFHNGFAPDLKSIGELCRRRGVLLCVDAIQSVGALVTDVRAANISFLAADSHKWILGPEGTAIFFAAEEVRDRLDVLETGWMNVARKGKWIGCDLDLFEDGRRFEAGTINTNGVYGATAALELLNEVGMETVEEEVVELANRLADGLERIGFEVKSPRPLRSGVVAATPRNPGSENIRRVAQQYEMANAPADYVLHRWLEDQGIICAPREHALRFSAHFYNTEEEIDQVIDALSEF